MLSISTIALLLLGPVLVWRVYTRIKAQMLRQRSIMQRHYTGLGVFTAMAVVPASQFITQPATLAWLLVGVVGGIAYGVWGLKLTRFETTREGYFFTPNPRLGLVIAMLFVACLMYIAFEIYANQGSGNPTPKVTDYPFTLPSLGLVAGYFATYSAGLLKWRFKLRKEINQA
ncbi:MAG TPA: hypothetical protein VGC21_09660 [Telluria sp.]|jgi:hypothetical protein